MRNSCIARRHSSGSYLDAAKEYEAAYEAKSDPALLFNIAQAYRFGGAHSDAVRSYRAFLRRVPKAQNRTEIEQQIARLQTLIDEQKHATFSPPSGMLTPGELGRAKDPSPPTPPTPSARRIDPYASPPSPSPGAVEVAPAPSAATAVRTTAPDRVPVYKKWWLWTIVGGVVVVGVGVGVGLALSLPNNAARPSGALAVSFP